MHSPTLSAVTVASLPMLQDCRIGMPRPAGTASLSARLEWSCRLGLALSRERPRARANVARCLRAALARAYHTAGRRLGGANRSNRPYIVVVAADTRAWVGFGACVVASGPVRERKARCASGTAGFAVTGRFGRVGPQCGRMLPAVPARAGTTVTVRVSPFAPSVRRRALEVYKPPSSRSQRTSPSTPLFPLSPLLSQPWASTHGRADGRPLHSPT
ncbi:hypothetical protein FKP32DRAFT_1157295 [Trametes sanguinea]|nr:hypothetical protein FKP32DRAFT_1157295 [Trametes sanguinea]